MAEYLIRFLRTLQRTARTGQVFFGDDLLQAVVLEYRRNGGESNIAVPDDAGSLGRTNHSRRSPTATAVGEAGNQESFKRQSYAFSILTVTTISSIICWVPLSVAGIVLIVAPFRPGFLLMSLSRILITQAVLDPILFTTASIDIRRGFRAVFRPSFSRWDAWWRYLVLLWTQLIGL